MEDNAERIGTTAPHKSTATWANILLALVAAFATLAIFLAVDPVFEVDAKYNIEGLGAADEKWVAYMEQKRIVDRRNAALVTGVLGGTLGLALAFVRPAAVSLVWRLVGGAALGLVVGLIAGTASSFLQQYFASLGQVTVLQSAMVQALLFGLMGLGLGAVSGGFTGARRAIADRAISGLVAGLIAGIAYPIIASVLFATANMDAMIPRSLAAQVLWLAVGAGVLGWLIPREASKPGPATAADM